ncbi:hypothetical protein swp_1642 [Shewanella piezotolerans WP3]|uniref:Uncharacterized protein n=1 Tax=Shewanella piezotolerans (strain WP3 / JCM 13877) TaxID=225849 RepID=B8CL94_SHEPW|nr:hypothetical protein swp_1642 [Shewanella piezotolerans WP3]
MFVNSIVPKCALLLVDLKVINQLYKLMACFGDETTRYYQRQS